MVPYIVVSVDHFDWGITNCTFLDDWNLKWEWTKFLQFVEFTDEIAFIIIL